jgi:hypothetical protein
MKTADLEIEAMAVAGNVVLKRTARTALEYGTENEASEHNAKKLTKSTRIEESASQKVENKACTSGVIAPAAAAMEPASKPYSRRGSIAERTSTDLADGNGIPRGGDSHGGGDSIKVADQVQDSPNHIKSSLKSHKLDPLHQDDRPLNFGEVLPGIYRSSFPKAEEYPFYKKLGLKTVV